MQEKDIRGYLDSRVWGEKKQGEGDLGVMIIEEFKTYFKTEIDAVLKVAIGK